jgi:16S rRNA (adenine1518-N6/adenine1519-N6)-dimethyltransferase
MRQRHGQNFLIDTNIANNIVRAANLEKQDEVLEIGPGKGILTRIIQPQVKYLTAVEIEEALFQQLNSYAKFNNIQNIKFINADFLKYDIPNTEFKIISNLPYNIGTAIIQKILPLKNWNTAVFTLQKEVAHRFTATPGSKSYGYISIFSSYYATSKIMFDIPPKCFKPAPKVISSVIKFTNKNKKQPNPLLFELVKHAFSVRRKTILNSLSSFRHLEKNKAAKVVSKCNLDPFLRPDRLSASDFLRLTSEMEKHTICRL